MAESGERRLLFDTRGRRRHVIRVVYAILALLMGASLFLVIGPFNIADLVGTSSTTNSSTVLLERAERTEQKLRTEPDNEDLLLSLARARVAAGNALTETNPETGTPVFTPEGRQQLVLADEAWNRYLKETDEPNPSAALLLAGSYFSLAETSGSLEEIEGSLEKAVAAQRIAVAQRPSIGSLSSLAIYEYFAGDFAAGDEAGKKAEGKSSKPEAKAINKQLAEYRQRAKSFAAQKKEIVKVEKEQGKEALQNPLGGLGGGTGLGE